MKKLLAITVLTLAAAGIVTGCSGKDIGRDAALEAAFNDAGVSESDTTRLKVSEDRDDGRKVYEIQFDVDNTEYDYEIQASDGSILSSETENRIQVQSNSQNGSDDAAGQNGQNAQNNGQDDGQNAQNNQGQTNTQTGNANVAVTREQAIETALSRVSGATEQDIRIELDRDDGVYKYEGDIIYNGMEYEFEIDANSGTILEWSEERF
ncbi:PepSY domain-containing protein [Mordavella massiliensis]|nr:PepSY domain-containing protein [Mordavella massiliensis]